MSNPYAILGLEDTATKDEVKKAYRKLAMQHHPDRNQNNQMEASAKFDQITKAYDRIINPTASDEDLEVFVVPLNMFNNYFGARIKWDDHVLSITAGSHPDTDAIYQIPDGPKVKLVYKFRPQPGFTYDGLNLHTTMSIWQSDIRWGREIPVPGHPDLFPPEILFPKDTKDGDRMRLVGRGLINTSGGRGDLIITVSFKDPTSYPNPNYIVKKESEPEPKELTLFQQAQRWLGWSLILYVIYIYWNAK